jgi:hypothetical protein
MSQYTQSPLSYSERTSEAFKSPLLWIVSIVTIFFAGCASIFLTFAGLTSIGGYSRYANSITVFWTVMTFFISVVLGLIMSYVPKKQKKEMTYLAALTPFLLLFGFSIFFSFITLGAGLIFMVMSAISTFFIIFPYSIGYLLGDILTSPSDKDNYEPTVSGNSNGPVPPRIDPQVYANTETQVLPEASTYAPEGVVSAPPAPPAPTASSEPGYLDADTTEILKAEAPAVPSSVKVKKLNS